MSNNSIDFMTISELSENIREKKLSPTEIVKEQLKTINKLNDSNKSFLYIAEEQSVKEAAGKKERAEKIDDPEKIGKAERQEKDAIAKFAE